MTESDIRGKRSESRRDNASFPETAPETITTARLVLTPLRPADAEAMVEVLGDARLHRYIGGRPDTLAELRGRYARLAAGSPRPDEIWLNWIVRLGTDPIGTVQATVVHRPDGWSAEAAWVIGVPWQGRGYAAEAAAALVEWLRARGAGTVTAHVHPDHLASAAVAARAGLAPTDEYVDGERVWRAQH